MLLPRPGERYETVEGEANFSLDNSPEWEQKFKSWFDSVRSVFGVWDSQREKCTREEREYNDPWFCEHPGLSAIYTDLATKRVCSCCGHVFGDLIYYDSVGYVTNHPKGGHAPKKNNHLRNFGLHDRCPVCHFYEASECSICGDRVFNWTSFYPHWILFTNGNSRPEAREGIFKFCGEHNFLYKSCQSLAVSKAKKWEGFKSMPTEGQIVLLMTHAVEAKAREITAEQRFKNGEIYLESA